MRNKTYIFFILILLTSCLRSDSWKIEEIKFTNNKSVFFKSYSWGIPDKNMIIISNSHKKEYDEKVDFDFGSFNRILYEVRNDSLYIFLANENQFNNIKKMEFNNTKIILVGVSEYLELTQKLQQFSSVPHNME
ncbi:hypothetical protein SAMN02927937_01755 [Paenimyroides aquimaris]|uniref:Uncharacterized protein n=1 Tax=Paenimyroides marinum TaxID=1159016 RepID=A0A1H6LK30_9FLAO|nr:hypothetical protein [Paenimyroides aquimaris]SEH84985.1 hypothetical protein SAMN02927937_01755 [Paenimyroides aquimaris]